MTPTYTAPTQTDFVAMYKYNLMCEPDGIGNTRYEMRTVRSGLTLTETIVVVFIVSLFVMLAQMNFSGVLRKSTFKAQVQDFVSTMQMAVNAAAESNRRYEVIIDLTEQSYMLREITSPDIFADVLEEEIIVENYFSENCWLEYVLFDDYEIASEESFSFTNEGRAMFRAGHSGWQYGGVIVLLDEDDRAYTVVVNRINKTVILQEGEIEPLTPRSQNEIPF